MNNTAIRRILPSARPVRLLVGVGVGVGVGMLAGLGAMPASADADDVTSSSIVSSPYRTAVTCWNTTYAPVVRTLNDSRYLEFRARLDCNGTVDSLTVRLYGCRQGQACDGPHTNTEFNSTSAQVVRRSPCQGSALSNSATVAYFGANGVYMTNKRAPETGWRTLSCS